MIEIVLLFLLMATANFMVIGAAVFLWLQIFVKLNVIKDIFI